MVTKANSFSLRGDSGLVRIVSDSPLKAGPGASGYSDEAECYISVESDGFRVNRTMVLSMPKVLSFLESLLLVLSGGEGEARLEDGGGDLSLLYRCDGGLHEVTCSMSDKGEGKENAVRVKYPIEPEYVAEIKSQLHGQLECAAGVFGAGR